jgi:hypothetical protein
MSGTRVGKLRRQTITDSVFSTPCCSATRASRPPTRTPTTRSTRSDARRRRRRHLPGSCERREGQPTATRQRPTSTARWRHAEDHVAGSLRPIGPAPRDLGAELRERGVGLHVIEQGIDTTTAEGRAMFGMLSVLAELQRELIVANTRDGLNSRTRPRTKGRPSPQAQPRTDRPRPAALRRGERAVQQIADIFNVPRTTVYGHLEESSKGKRPAVHRTPADA